MAEATWFTTALPWMEYVHDHGGPMSLLSVGDVAEAANIDPLTVVTVVTELDRLERSGYL